VGARRTTARHRAHLDIFNEYTWTAISGHASVRCAWSLLGESDSARAFSEQPELHRAGAPLFDVQLARQVLPMTGRAAE